MSRVVPGKQALIVLALSLVVLMTGAVMRTTRDRARTIKACLPGTTRDISIYPQNTRALTRPPAKPAFYWLGWGVGWGCASPLDNCMSTYQRPLNFTAFKVRLSSGTSLKSMLSCCPVVGFLAETFRSEE